MEHAFVLVRFGQNGHGAFAGSSADAARVSARRLVTASTALMAGEPTAAVMSAAKQGAERASAARSIATVTTTKPTTLRKSASIPCTCHAIGKQAKL